MRVRVPTGHDESSRLHPRRSLANGERRRRLTTSLDRCSHDMPPVLSLGLLGPPRHPPRASAAAAPTLETVINALSRCLPLQRGCSLLNCYQDGCMQLPFDTLRARLRGALEIPASIELAISFNHRCPVSARKVTLAPLLCVPTSSLRSMPAEGGCDSLVWGSSCFDWPSTSAPLSIVSLAHWLLLSILTEMKRQSLYAALRNASHAFTPHLPYSAVCFPKPDFLTSTMAP